MKSLCFYFQVHQPFRLRTYRFFDIGENHYYFDEYRNRYIMKRIADKCYLPMNKVLLDLINQYGKDFKVSFSISGIALEQFRLYVPEVLKSFQKLADTGSVEFLAETYSHSLAALKSKTEFFRQVNMQSDMVEELFGQRPRTFRNTELIYSDMIGADVAELGFKTMLTEGAKHILGWKSPNFMYCNAINPKLRILLKNFQLSDDIAFRFSQQDWNGWPLNAEKFVDWINAIQLEEETVNLFMDYETFGEHQWPETGIFEFMKALPARIFSHSEFKFRTPSDLYELLQPVAAVHVPHPISWADEERDLTAWLGNELQNDAFDKLYEVEDKVIACGDEEILRDWRYLQTSDHFYYMCTKWFSDGDVHKYFNPYNSPYEAYVNYMNIWSDFLLRVEEAGNPPTEPKPVTKADVTKVIKKKVAAKPKAVARRKKPKAATIKPSPQPRATEKKPENIDMGFLLNVSNTALHKALKTLDAFTIGLAISGADKKVVKHVMNNVGIRILDKLKTIKIDAAEFHPRELERCRKKIIDKLSKSKRSNK